MEGRIIINSPGDPKTSPQFSHFSTFKGSYARIRNFALASDVGATTARFSTRSLFQHPHLQHFILRCVRIAFANP
ncbi:MAG TPA: hypothetical protein VI864_02560 [Candidatus Bathyarchaeia archaeon]|nr:hypothetical protein [Candidatus Bathyarchaeia archaeon]